MPLPSRDSAEKKAGYRLPHTPPSLASMISSSFFPARRAGRHALLLSSIALRGTRWRSGPDPAQEFHIFAALDLPVTREPAGRPWGSSPRVLLLALPTCVVLCCVCAGRELAGGQRRPLLRFFY